MKENSPSVSCPKCGASLAIGTREGLCPACRLAPNLATQTESSGGINTPGDLGEVATAAAAGSTVYAPAPSAPPPPEPRLSLAAVAGAIGVFFFVTVMFWWLVDPELMSDWYAATSPWKELFDSYIKPAGFAALLAATGLGWMAVWNIRRSSGRRYGLALAVFDGLVLPLLVLDMVILILWTIAIKALASWRGLDGSMVRSLWEFALLAILMGASIAWIDYLILLPVWRRVTRNPQPGSGAFVESAGTRGNLRLVAIAIAVATTILLPLGVIVNETLWKARFGYAAMVGDVRYRVFEARAAVLDPLVPAALRHEGFNRAPRTRDGAAARHKTQTAELDEAALATLYAHASTNSGFLAERRLAGREIWRAQGKAWSYDGQWGAGSGAGGLRLTDKDHVYQLGTRYHVSHTFPGAPAPVTAEISYQGEAPPLDCARVFLVPYMRDGRDAYLVIAFEVNGGQ